MLDFSITFDLIGQIYDAAVAPELWRTFLESLAAAVGGGVGRFALTFPSAGSLGVHTASRDSEEATREYAEYYHARDPWVQWMDSIRSELGVTVDWGALVPPEHARRTEFWNDFLRRQGIGYEAPIGVILRREQGRAIAGCSVHPLEGQEPYGDDEVALMDLLGPHLVRAVGMHRLLSEHRVARTAEAEILDRMPFAVLLVDAQGRVVQANAFAGQLMAEGDGLRCNAARLAGATPAITHALGRLIGGAIARGSDPASQMGGAVSLPRPAPRRPLEALVAPIRAGAAAWMDGRSLAVVFVSDPECRVEPPIETLRHLYGLTPGEAAVATRLGGGATLDETADALHITRNTARFYLKRVFAKTNTHRQAELVLLLASGVASLRDEWPEEGPEET